MIIGGGLNESGNETLVYLNGCGVLSNIFTALSTNTSGTNAFETTNNSANWTLLDNPTATPITLPWGFEILAGTFNFGSATSAPNFTSTPANGTISPNLDNQVGDIAGATATFNMVNGTLTSSARFNTALLTDSTGIINMSGGAWNMGSQFQGANGSNPGEVSLLNVSGGTLNLGTAAAPTSQLYVASRGSGTFTISGSAAVNCGNLDVSRNADGNTIGSSGTVNLNGGTLTVSLVGTATANSQAGPASSGPNPSAAFNFNGGTLLARANSATFFLGSTTAPIIPITTTVKSGGAIINDGGFAISILEVLLHDSALGATPDGGLTKLGAGTLTLTRANSYTGPTAVNAGTLAVSGSLAAASAVTVAAGATLNLTGAVAGNVTLNGTGTGVGPIGGNLIINSTGTNNGAGSISGSLTNAGLLSPGASVATATLTVLGNVTDLAGGTTALLLNRGASPSNSVIFSGGTITFAGTLSVTNIGSALQLGDSFKLFNGAYAGSFDSLALPPLAANLGWSNSLSVNGAISVVATVVPVPGINSFLQSGGNLVFSGTNGPASGAYYVLTSTNLSLPLSNWTVLSTNSFDASGNFSVTNPILGGGPPGFFILELAPQ